MKILSSIRYEKHEREARGKGDEKQMKTIFDKLCFKMLHRLASDYKMQMPMQKPKTNLTELQVKAQMNKLNFINFIHKNKLRIYGYG